MRYEQTSERMTGEELARQGLLEGTFNAHCYRCGRDPDIAHDRTFCPALADYKEAGTWLSFNKILRVLIKYAKGSISVNTASRVEEHEGANDTWHAIVGLAYEGEYMHRMDAPNVPEFAIYGGTRGHHPMLYAGWRPTLRLLCRRMRIDYQKVCRELGVSPDRSTEETARFKTGFF